jgi:hypothetical protein
MKRPEMPRIARALAGPMLWWSLAGHAAGVDPSELDERAPPGARLPALATGIARVQCAAWHRFPRFVFVPALDPAPTERSQEASPAFPGGAAPAPGAVPLPPAAAAAPADGRADAEGPANAGVLPEL